VKDLKVVFLHNDFKLYWKGRLYYLRNFLANHGISMNVIEIFGQGLAYSFDKVTNTENWWECLFPYEPFNELEVSKVRQRILKRLDELNPDCIISGGIAFTSGAIGLQWVKHHRKKILFFDDIKHSISKRNIFIKFIKRTLTVQADAYLIPSHDYDVEYLNWGIDRSKLYYGLSCVNNHYYANKKKSSSKSIKLIICVARLVPIKNIDGLLRAWEKVELKFPNYHLIIVGDGPEYPSLKILAEELKLFSVKFLGVMTSRNIAKIFSECDAFILPSFSESWGMVLNEAMASGLPIISSNRINAAIALLVEGENGYLFDPYNVDEITTTLLKHIESSSKKKIEMSQSAKKSIRKYSYKFFASEVFRALSDSTNRPIKEPNPLIKIGINYWNGKFITDGWDSIK
jgi:glycosyltransferase involved in cell wall biosynthesis